MMSWRRDLSNTVIMEENNQQKAKVHIMADSDCEVYMFGNHICSIKAGESKEFYMLKGNKKICAVSVANPADKIELIYSVTDTDIEDFIELKFKEVRRKKELKNTIVTTAKKCLKISMWILLISLLLFVFILIFNNKSENTTQSQNKTGNVHEYVDLGLSVKWATCNVGANSPEEYGDYFAWGETKPKEEYNWETYTFCWGARNTMNKYCIDSYNGKVDNKTTLELTDDAARVNWGSSWRMPTREELNELEYDCSWTWTTQNGVEGYKVISKKNGNSIFLPAAGHRYYDDLSGAGRHGYYLSSSLGTSNYAFGVDLYFSHVSLKGYFNDRCEGRSVRAVCE